MLLADTAAPAWSWNLIGDFQQMWSFPFMVNAFRAGAIVAVVSATVGWFVVLRRQTFAAHTVSTVAFPGAAGAVLLGVSAVYGYFALCVAAALVIAALRGSGDHEESALTGTVQAFLLACGFLFIALYKGLLEGPQTILFGTFLGITSTQVTVLTGVGIGVLAVLALIGRQLLFASVDPQVAAGRGVPVRALSVAFLVLLGAATAEASQITGTLLVFALMVIPAATAQTITARPGPSLALAVLLALAATWLGLTAAYYWPYPLGFFVTSFAFAGYVIARGAHALHTIRGRIATPLPAKEVAA
ncbi:metal ABC transporter permease [Streptomyces noursei]|uniref:metal ABC transporter permease n=1 Tax=Streptomyces noursei TaxID=1971 RepID=UPI00167651AB|nr:metal ABC transporter permease [Streptomyces noursei]MCZ1012734.1 metal ABC transporter permease [Streptomyces noursei]GGX42428.1 zinc ABC transporter permease [Streptomyces noursei]